MNRLLQRLERRFGRWAIPNLITYVVAISGLAWVLEMARPGFSRLLLLDLSKVEQGEVWRLVTFFFIPPATGPIWVLFCLYFSWLVGTALEAQWGAFKLNCYYLLGALGTFAAAFIWRESIDNFYLNTSLFLAFATLFPEFEILVLFILPVKVKWLGLLTFILLLSAFLQGSMAVRAGIAISLGNYLLFFYPVILDRLRRGYIQSRSFRRRIDFEPPPREHRRCKICGKCDDDPQVDMRVCTCEKCGEPTDYCLEHARNH
jgi:hypothetical protein